MPRARESEYILERFRGRQKLGVVPIEACTVPTVTPVFAERLRVTGVVNSGRFSLFHRIYIHIHIYIYGYRYGGLTDSRLYILYTPTNYSTPPQLSYFSQYHRDYVAFPSLTSYIRRFILNKKVFLSTLLFRIFNKQKTLSM